MISGRDTLGTMEQAISNARAEESRLDATLTAATEEAAQLRGSLGDAFRALAKLRLDEISSATVTSRLDETETRALALMKEAQTRILEIARRRDAAAATIAAIEAERMSAAEAVEAVEKEIDTLIAATEARVSAEPGWIAAKSRSEEAARIAEESQRKAEQADQDRKVKGAPYEGDRLFMYLWGRNFGTSAYLAEGLTRFLDRRVAALVGYSEARPNYAMLIEIPARLRAHAARRLAEIEEAKTELAAIERRFLEADGIVALEDRLKTAEAALDAIDHRIAEARAELDTIDREHAEALSPATKTGVGEAVDLIASELAGEDLQTLYRQAHATPDPRDEAILRRIEDLNIAIARSDRLLADVRRNAREVAARRSELEGVRDDFRRKGYDRSDVVFGNEHMIGQMIGGIIGGALRSPDLWRVLNQGYGRQPRRQGPTFGGGSGSSNSRGDRGGFSTGGGFGGGDNRGGGGFSTGGGF